MVKLKKKIRDNVLDKFKNVLNKFPAELVVKLLADKTERPSSYYNIVLFLHLLHYNNFEKISDMELIILSGKYDYVLPNGMSYFTPDQTLALNELSDAIFEMRHSEDK